MLHPGIIQLTEELIAEGETMKAIEYLKERTLKMDDIQRELNLLSSRGKQIHKEHLRGLITDGEHRVEVNKITYALQSIIYENQKIAQRLTNAEILVERGKLIKEEEEMQKAISKFKNTFERVDEFEEMVKSFFTELPVKVNDFATNSNIRIQYDTNIRDDMDGKIDFKGRIEGALRVLWVRRMKILSDAKLTVDLYDRPYVYGQHVPFKQYEPRVIKKLEFEPTLNKNMDIGWTSNNYHFISNIDIINICLEMVIDRME